MGKLAALKELKRAYLQQMFSREGERVPRLRFAGFAGDWAERKFCNIVNRVSLQSNAENLPKVEFEDIVSGEGVLNKNISNKFDKRKGIAFEPGNILYGKLRPYLKNWLYADFKGVALGDFWVFKAENSISSFVYYLIQAEKYQEVANLSTGTKMPRSDWKIVSETEFAIPTEDAEQTAIGNLFGALDELITLHQRKLDCLRKLKVACLQMMFPQAGERVPRLRFAGFAGDWEERKLGEVASVFDGTHQTPKYINSGVKFVSVENIKDLAGTDKFISVEDYNSQFKTKAEIGDIFMTRITAGIIGETAIVEDEEDFAYYVSLALIKPRRVMDSKYLNYYIATQSFRSELNEKIIHTAFPKKINLNEIGKCEVSYPDSDEQQKIGNFFRTLDETINLYS